MSGQVEYWAVAALEDACLHTLAAHAVQDFGAGCAELALAGRDTPELPACAALAAESLRALTGEVRRLGADRHQLTMILDRMQAAALADALGRPAQAEAQGQAALAVMAEVMTAAGVAKVYGSPAVEHVTSGLYQTDRALRRARSRGRPL